MGIPSIILHNVINGHAVNLTLDQPIDREITVFFPMVPGKDTITLISDEYLTAKITAEVTNQVNTVVMQKVTDEINNQFATTIMPKIEQSIIDYDQNVTARFNDVKQSIQDLETKVTDITNNAINGLTVKLDQEIIDRKEGDRILEEKIQEIYNIFDSKPNDNIDGTITDMQETMKKLIRISKDTASFLNTNPDYEDNSLVLKKLTDFETGKLTKRDLDSLDASGSNTISSDNETIYKNILQSSDYNSNTVIKRESSFDAIIDKINNDIKTLGVSLTRNVPTGTIIAIPYNGDIDPEINRNYLKCDGKSVPRSVYPELGKKFGLSMKEGRTLTTSFINITFKDIIEINNFVDNIFVMSHLYSRCYNENNVSRAMPEFSGVLLYLSKPSSNSQYLTTNTQISTTDKGYCKYVNTNTFEVGFKQITGSNTIEKWDITPDPGITSVLYVKECTILGTGLYFKNNNYEQVNGLVDSNVIFNTNVNSKIRGKVVSLRNGTNLIMAETDFSTRPNNTNGYILVSNHPVSPVSFEGLSLNKTTIYLDNMYKLYGFLYDKSTTNDNPRKIGKHMYGKLDTWFEYILQTGRLENFVLENIFRLNKITNSYENISMARLELENDRVVLKTNNSLNKESTIELPNELNLIKVLDLNNTSNINYFFYQKGDDNSDDMKDVIYNRGDAIGIIGDQFMVRILGSQDNTGDFYIGSGNFNIDIIGIDNSFHICTYDLSVIEEEATDVFSLNKLFKTIKEDSPSTNIGFDNSFSLNLNQFVDFYKETYGSVNDILESVFVNYKIWGTDPNRISFLYKNTGNVPCDIKVFPDNSTDLIEIKAFNTIVGTVKTQHFKEIIGTDFNVSYDGYFFLLNITKVDTNESLEDRIVYLPRTPSTKSVFNPSLRKELNSFYCSGSLNNTYCYRTRLKDNATYRFTVYPLNIFSSQNELKYKPGTNPTPLAGQIHSFSKRLKGPIMYNLYKYGYFMTENSNNLSSVVFDKREDYKNAFFGDTSIDIPFEDLKKKYIGTKNEGIVYKESHINTVGTSGLVDIDFFLSSDSCALAVNGSRELVYYDLNSVTTNGVTEGYMILIRIRMIDPDTNKVIISDKEFPVVLFVYNASTTVPNDTALNLPGARVIQVPSGTNVVSVIKKQVDIQSQKYKVEVIALTTLSVRRNILDTSFKIPDLRDDFLRYDENNLGSKVDWTIPQIQGSFKIAGTSAGFDNHQGVFQPGTKGTFPSSSTGNAGATSVFDLNNLPSYRKHINSNGKMHPDYTGVQYWIKF